MTVDDATIAVTMGFVPDSVAVADVDHPGLLRAGPRASAPYGHDNLEQHVCPATDTCQDDAAPPDLLELGFDTVDLSGFDDLQQACARVRDAGLVTDEDATTIRSALAGRRPATAPAAGPSPCSTCPTRASSCARPGPTGCRSWGPGRTG